MENGFLYAMAGHFPLVELIAARLRPASEETLARARAAVREEKLLAAFEVGAYTIVLADDLRCAWPFGGALIGLLAPGVEGICEVLRVDVWNPPSRAVIDGDAFALRRLCEWLGGALIVGGLDVEIVYSGEEDAEEDEDEEGGEREAPARVMLSEWLRFGLPDVGDRFLVDWRHQWHIAFAGVGIVACFGGIYGMSGELRARLDGRDRQVWRSFLRDVIDPRFGA